jgi:hypothetical protein
LYPSSSRTRNSATHDSEEKGGRKYGRDEENYEQEERKEIVYRRRGRTSGKEE